MPLRELGADGLGVGFLDEVDGVADIDDVEVREILLTPCDLGLFDGDPGVSVEKQIGDLSVSQPFPIGLDDGKPSPIGKGAEIGMPCPPTNSRRLQTYGMMLSAASTR